MKKLILIILFITGVNCYGQKKDSTRPRLSDYKGVIEGFNTTAESNTTKPKQDTIRCLMLVCDTSSTEKLKSIQRKGNIVSMQTEFHYDGNVWWQFGYEVTESKWYEQSMENRGETILVTPAGYITRFIGYLDQNKKPLSKNIVVWVTKEI